MITVNRNSTTEIYIKYKINYNNEIPYKNKDIKLELDFSNIINNKFINEYNINNTIIDEFITDINYLDISIIEKSKIFPIYLTIKNYDKIKIGDIIYE